MNQLKFFKHGKWQIHSVGTWMQCLDLGHKLFGQHTPWEIV